jgi:3'-phosphoadenosine 5'-phosphosulfate sulfotransferase (PAPS reductase)/FAD synthetase
MVDGVCGFCRDEKLKIANNDAERSYQLDVLRQSLTSHKSSGNNNYDCLVPVSGGKDSSYILYYLVREMKLKPFAVFFDSGFTHDMARKNVENICTKLGVDWTIIKSPHDYRRKAVVEAFYLWKSRRDFPLFCNNCENNLRAMAINEALAKGISHVIWGSTDYEDSASVYKSSNASRKTFRESYGNTSILASLSRLYHDGLPLLRNPYHIFKHYYYIVRDNFDMKVPGGLKKIYPIFEVPFNYSPVEVVYLFDYIDYNPLKQIDVLKKELGWEAPAGKESRMDCRLHCFINYSSLYRTNITNDGFVMAKLVRKGLMDRSEALKREDLIRKSLDSDCLETTRYLGIKKFEIIPVRGKKKPFK